MIGYNDEIDYHQSETVVLSAAFYFSVAATERSCFVQISYRGTLLDFTERAHTQAHHRPSAWEVFPIVIKQNRIPHSTLLLHLVRRVLPYVMSCWVDAFVSVVLEYLWFISMFSKNLNTVRLITFSWTISVAQSIYYRKRRACRYATTRPNARVWRGRHGRRSW